VVHDSVRLVCHKLIRFLLLQKDIFENLSFFHIQGLKEDVRLPVHSAECIAYLDTAAGQVPAAVDLPEVFSFRIYFGFLDYMT
jgi:hypothetical protein